MEMKEIKKWLVCYDHNDGRSGKVKVITILEKVPGSLYGNQTYGSISINGVGTASRLYDLRYEKGDLHLLMIEDYFGAGLCSVERCK